MPPGAVASALAAAVLRAGVAVAPGRPYYAAEPPAPHVRLSFAPAAGLAELVEGVRRLGVAWGECFAAGPDQGPSSEPSSGPSSAP
ncbi:hypothetical protein [Streptomyces mayteni]